MARILADSKDSTGFIVWILVIVAMVLVGYAVVIWVKRRLRDDEPPSAGFSLSDLRAMLRNGQITQDEFDKAKGRMTAGMLNQNTPRKPPA